MARYIGPVCKLVRREGSDLQVKTRDIETKCKFDKAPGQHGDRRGRLSDYGLQLRMKQKIKRSYGLLERQFRCYYAKADRMVGETGENLLRQLECRLDNIVFRMGFATTRREARQLVTHGAILANGDRVTIPSYQVKPGEVISISESGRQQSRVMNALELAAHKSSGSPWLEVDSKKLSGVLKYYPKIDELPVEFKVKLVIELYSK